jgi:hypothetical protein
MELYKNVDGVREKLTEEEIFKYDELQVETKNEMFQQLREQKLAELKSNNENSIYSVYPVYKQNNLAIYGSKKDKADFKVFRDERVVIYDSKIEEIEECSSIEELEKVNIGLEVDSNNII